MRVLLNNTYRLEQRINSEIEELERLKYISENISSAFPDGDKLQGGLKKDRLANLVVKIVDHQAKLEKRVNEYLSHLVGVEERIEKLENDDEKLVLRLRYINNKKWDEIAEIMNCTVSNIYKIHKRAIIS